MRGSFRGFPSHRIHLLRYSKIILGEKRKTHFSFHSVTGKQAESNNMKEVKTIAGIPAKMLRLATILIIHK